MSSSNTISRVSNMTKTHKHNIMQIMLFQLNDEECYGINVSKIKSIEDYNRYKVSKNEIKNNKTSEILEGHINYHKQIIPFLNIEKWMGMYKPGNRYMETIVCEYNRKIISFPIYDIENIFNVNIEDLQTSDHNDNFVTYSTLIKLGEEEVVCRVLDVEQLLVDVFGMDDTVKSVDRTGLDSDKLLLIAEDSKSARAIIEEILEGTDIEYHMFEDGEKIINFLDSLSDNGAEKIGLVITDLEMPYRDGYQVISHIKNSNNLNNIPIVVNSSMSDVGVKVKTEQLGSVAFIGKTDPKSFLKAIKDHMRS